MILLPLGGLAFGVGWLVGLILLWSSRLWTTRDKLIGTLIVPGGIATSLWVFVFTGTSTTSPMCHGRAAQINPATGAVIRPASIHCTPSNGPSLPSTVWHIALIAFCVLGPIMSAIYLARRAGRYAPTMIPGVR